MKTIKNSTVLALLLLITMGVIAFFSVREDSVTTDESPHITAGYSYLKLQDMRLNPEHPPLIKDLAAIPLLFQKIHFPLEHPAWTSMVNAQWDLGPQFLYRSGNDPDKIIFWGRIPAILLTLLFGWFVFKWARELFGDKWALFTLTLFVFSPEILAHGRLVTTDVPAAFAFFAAIYYYLKFLKNPSRKNLVIAGVVFAIAQLTKFSLVLLIGFLPAVTIVWIFATEFKPKQIWLWTVRLSVILAITAIIIYPVYQFHVLNYPPEKQAADIQHILQNNKFPALTDVLVWMADKPILRAYAQYMLGVAMVFMRVAGGNTTYFLGEVSNQAWWYYFPVVFFLKVPTALLILIAVSILLFIKQVWGRFVTPSPSPPSYPKREGAQDTSHNSPPSLKVREGVRGVSYYNFDEIAMLLFVLFYWFISVTGNLNIGVRHVLPSFPFLYLLIGGQLKRWFDYHPLSPSFVRMGKVAVLAILLLWYIFSSLKVYPHFIAHFNELAGGADGGYRSVVDSNVDWGQDLRRLKKYVEENNIEKIKVDYFGGGDVKYYLGEKAQIWHADNGPASGWLAVSATFMQTSRAYPWASYEWLDEYQPVAKIGYSIFVYNIKK